MSEAQKAREVKPRRKVMVGEVVGTRMEKTVIVHVRRKMLHPLYKKYYVRGIRYKVHDSESKCKIGDRVSIVECRPISRHKKWRVNKILRSAE